MQSQNALRQAQGKKNNPVKMADKECQLYIINIDKNIYIGFNISFKPRNKQKL